MSVSLKDHQLVRRVAGAVVALVTLSVTSTSAQTTTFAACYVPQVGAMYLIKLAGLPSTCLSANHVEINWSEGPLVDGSVTTVKLADGAVSLAKIADGAVSEAKLTFNPATQAELDAFIANLRTAGTINQSSNPLDWTQLKNVPAGFSDGVDNTGGASSDVDCVGCVGTDELEDLAVSTGKVADGTVTTAKLAPDAVTSVNILDGSVGTSDLADGSVTAAKLATDVGTGVTDHGGLTGLGDDDHPQYLHVNGARALTANLSAGGHKVVGLGPATADGDAVRFEQAVKAGDLAAGDLAGTYPTPTVAALRGNPLGASTPAPGQVLTWSGAVWEGAMPTTGVTDHGSLGGLTHDDHPQYILTNGTRTATDGFAVTGTVLQGTIPVIGAGTRLMWYPRKAAFRAGEVGGTQWDDINVGTHSLAVGYHTVASGGGSVAAGANTTASGSGSIAIGYLSIASGNYSAALNGASTASGDYSLAIGVGTTASGLESTAIGSFTTASGDYSMAIGRRANTNGHVGTLVYGDDSGDPDILHAQAANSFVVRAQRVWFGKSGDQVATSDRYIETSTGAYLSDGGAWTNASDAERKENFRGENAEAVLASLARLPIHSWNYTDEDPVVRHLGPTAQDFFAAFGLGDSEKTISTIDAAGVALLAIQALEQRTRDLTAMRQRIFALEGEIEGLRADLAELRTEIGDQLAGRASDYR